MNHSWFYGLKDVGRGQHLERQCLQTTFQASEVEDGMIAPVLLGN